MGISAYACLRGLKRAPFRTAIIDGLDQSTLARGKLLGVAIALARQLRTRCPEQRIGIVLPPGKGGVVANLAVTLAGKIPVNLNFTSSRDAIESAKTQANLQTIVERARDGAEIGSISVDGKRPSSRSTFAHDEAGHPLLVADQPAAADAPCSRVCCMCRSWVEKRKPCSFSPAEVPARPRASRSAIAIFSATFLNSRSCSIRLTTRSSRPRSLSSTASAAPSRSGIR